MVIGLSGPVRGSCVAYNAPWPIWLRNGGVRNLEVRVTEQIS